MSTANICISLDVETIKYGDVFVSGSRDICVFSQGSTEDEAIRNFLEAAELFFETLIDDGTPKKCAVGISSSYDSVSGVAVVYKEMNDDYTPRSVISPDSNGGIKRWIRPGGCVEQP